MGCSPGWGFKERDYKAASYLLEEKSELGLSIYIHVYMYIYIYRIYSRNIRR